MSLKEDAKSDPEEAKSMIPEDEHGSVIIEEPGTEPVPDKSEHLIRYLVTALISISFLCLVKLWVPNGQPSSINK